MIFKKFIKDRRGGSEAIAFLAGFIILVFFFIQYAAVIRMELDQAFMVLAYKKGLDQMQISGGLTSNIEEGLKDYLEKFGLERDKIVIDGTIAPVDWGGDLYLEIEYKKDYTKYQVNSVVNITKQTVTMNLVKDGSTVSYYFDNN